VGSAGPHPVTRPEDADVDEPVGDELCLAMRGRPLAAEDRGVLAAFAAQVGVLWQQRRLAEAAEAAKPIAAADRMRTALLAAVSHDLRTPLAAVKASLSGLRSGVEWDAAERAELLATADESADQLARLVDNLLDASRLQAGVLSVATEATALDEIVASALDDLGPPGADVTVAIPALLPEVLADPALLERVAANLLSNAVRYSPRSKPPAVTASALGDRVELRVIDRGPGIPADQREHVFAPFERLGDPGPVAGAAGAPGGTGLGLALSRGLTEAMGGTLTPEETPGGGLTMIVSLPAAPGGDGTAARPAAEGDGAVRWAGAPAATAAPEAS
jgi:two-component system sensor histidine kinase KdpD